MSHPTELLSWNRHRAGQRWYRHSPYFHQVHTLMEYTDIKQITALITTWLHIYPYLTISAIKGINGVYCHCDEGAKVGPLSIGRLGKTSMSKRWNWGAETCMMNRSKSGKGSGKQMSGASEQGKSFTHLKMNRSLLWLQKWTGKVTRSEASLAGKLGVMWDLLGHERLGD